MRSTQQEIATPTLIKESKVRSQRINTPTKYLTYTAVFAALAIVMKIIGQYLTLTDSFKITLIYTVWIIAGAVLGPLGGGAVCFISDFLGALIIPKGALLPLVTLANVAYGVIAGFAFKIPFKSYAIRFITSWLMCTAFCTCIFNSLALWYSYGYYQTLTFWQYFIANRLLQIAVAAINLGVTLAMIPLLIRIRLLPKIKKGKSDKTLTTKGVSITNA